MKTWKHKYNSQDIATTIDKEGQKLYLTGIIGTNFENLSGMNIIDAFNNIELIAEVRCVVNKQGTSIFSVEYKYDHLKFDKEINKLINESKKMLEKYVYEDRKKGI